MNDGILTGPEVHRQKLQEIFVEQLRSTPKIGANSVTGFVAIFNAVTGGVDVSFAISDATGMSSITLLRASTPDIAQATVLQTWSASASKFAWSDTDKALQAMQQAYYWLKLEPVNRTGSEVNVGPQTIVLNPSLIAPGQAAAISASHAAAANGTVLVTVNVSGLAISGSLKIYVSGYQGVAGFVAVAQKTTAPLQFGLQATGETVTLKAIAVSSAAVEAATGPTTTLVLTATATIPATPEGVTVAQIATGNQISIPANLEANVTAYQIWRGTRGDPFSAATLLATVAASGTATIVHLDTGGLSGDFQYFVIAVSGSGNSLASDAAYPPVVFTLAGQTVISVIDNANSAIGSVILQNVNFAAGNVGWSITGGGAGWAILAGAGYNGSGYFARYTGTIASSFGNNQKISCAVGAVLSASAYIEGSAGSTGQAVVRVSFRDSGGTELSAPSSGNAVPNAGWNQVRVVATAPASTAYAIVDVTVRSETVGFWDVGVVTASILANTLDEVPDGPAFKRVTAVVGGQVTTPSIVTGAVSSQISFLMTSPQNISAGTSVSVGTVTQATDGGFVSVRAVFDLAQQFASASASPITLAIYRGTSGGTLLATHFASALLNGAGSIVAIEAVDTSPAPSQQYTLVLTVGAGAVAVTTQNLTMFATNYKV